MDFSRLVRQQKGRNVYVYEFLMYEQGTGCQGVDGGFPLSSCLCLIYAFCTYAIAFGLQAI
jgi:hypothetical protein